MLILTGSVVEDKQEVLCSVCKRVVGLFDLSEIGQMSVALNAIYCFECDTVVADSVHPSLYDDSERYFLFFDGVCRSINLQKEVRAKVQIINRKNDQIELLYQHLREVFWR